MQEHFKVDSQINERCASNLTSQVATTDGSSMAPAPIKLIAASALFLYPIAIYFANDYLSPSKLMAGLLLLLAARLLVIAWINPARRRWSIVLGTCMVVAAITVPLFMPDVKMVYLRLYPALFSLLAFALFFGSLFTRMPLAERFARMTHHYLPPQGVIYTRHLTWAWCSVLLCNMLVSLYTAIFTSFEAWSLYNGVIVYFVFGGIFVCEYLIRTHLRRKWSAE
jgi:uncharacterized membrane protein